ncbi:MAG: HEAT repeat domain-containing protein [Bradymonadales bacterium]
MKVLQLHKFRAKLAAAALALMLATSSVSFAQELKQGEFVQDNDALDVVISHLTRESEAIVAALERMAVICDTRCTPLVAELMRHEDLEVQVAAIRTAARLADAQYLPALTWLLRSTGVAELKVEAARAILAIGGDDALRSLLHMIDPLKIDVTQLLIVESLLQEGDTQYVSLLIDLAEEPMFYASVLNALEAQKELLKPEFKRALRDSAGSRRELLLLRIMADIGLGLWTPRWDALLLEQTQALGLLSEVIAPVDDLEAQRWLLNVSKDWSERVLLRVLPKLNPVHGYNMASNWVMDYKSRSYAVKREILKQFAKTKNLFSLSLLQEESATAESEELRFLALKALAQYGERLEVREVFAELLLSSSKKMRYLAAEFWLQQDDARAFLLDFLKRHAGEERSAEALWAYAQVLLPEDRAEALELVKAYDEDWKHALSYNALLLRRKLGDVPKVSAWANYESAPPHTQRLLLQILMEQRPDEAATWLRYCLAAQDTATRGLALWGIGRLDIHEDWAELALRESLQSSDPILLINALASVGVLKRASFVHAVSAHIYNDNDYVVYNALWALQQLKVLPSHGELRALYFRSKTLILRQLLARLLSLPSAYDMAAKQGNKDYFLGISVEFQGERVAGENVILLYPNGALQLLQTDVNGRIELRGRHAQGIVHIQ